MSKPILNIGLIGTGFMGKTHAFGFAMAPRVFDLPCQPVLHTVADMTEDSAARGAAALGFANSTADWRRMIDDPDIDVIDITAPNALHKDMALAAIAAGKHVYCEKPLAPSAADAQQMARAAAAKGVTTQVGFNYLCNPMLRLARKMIAAGATWARSAAIAAFTPRTTWPIPTAPGPSATIRRAAAPWPTSAATRLRPPNSCWVRLPRSWATA